MSMFTSISLIAISDQKQGQHKLCFLVRGVSMWARAWCWVQARFAGAETQC
jgi:hypothetical protein